MTHRAFLLAALGLAVGSAVPAAAQDAPSYSLSDPTPRGALRDMSTDRPDKTESPYTVDAGRVQVELDFVTWMRDDDDRARLRTERINVAPINVKLGLSRSADIQVIFDSYLRETVADRATGAMTRAEGVGDVTVRLKRNLWGNDGGRTAFGVMPFVKLPTNTNGLGNNAVEFGIIAPLAIAVAPGVGVGLMTEFDFLRSSNGNGLSPSFVNSATLGFDLSERMGLYAEIFTEKRGEANSDWIVTFDAGLTFALTDDVQIDTGVNLGLTRAADDVSLFVGLSRRF